MGSLFHFVFDKRRKKGQLKKLRAAVNSDSKPRKKAYMDKKQQYNYTFMPTFCQAICENKKENRLPTQSVLPKEC